MLKIHTNDGKTHRVDLLDEKQAEEWLLRLKSHKFQKIITGMSVVQDCHSRVRCPCCNRTGNMMCTFCGEYIPNDFHTVTGVQYSLSRPILHRTVFYTAENVMHKDKPNTHGGERITCFADDTKISIMVYRSQPSARVNLHKIGHQRYNPYSR
jgi:hypothetical protein